MSLNSKTEIGRIGEEMAVKFLREKGLKIIKTNWRYHHLELDIIAEDEKMLVFVEVKTRTSSYFGNPEDAVSKTKMARIINAAEAYILEKDSEQEARFDVIAILLPPGGKPEIEYFEDAFFA
jgi:putative endonuclease